MHTHTHTHCKHKLPHTQAPAPSALKRSRSTKRCAQLQSREGHWGCATNSLLEEEVGRSQAHPQEGMAVLEVVQVLHHHHPDLPQAGRLKQEAEVGHPQVRIVMIVLVLRRKKGLAHTGLRCAAALSVAVDTSPPAFKLHCAFFSIAAPPPARNGPPASKPNGFTCYLVRDD